MYCVYTFYVTFCIKSIFCSLKKNPNRFEKQECSSVGIQHTVFYMATRAELLHSCRVCHIVQNYLGGAPVAAPSLFGFTAVTHGVTITVNRAHFQSTMLPVTLASTIMTNSWWVARQPMHQPSALLTHTHSCKTRDTPSHANPGRGRLKRNYHMFPLHIFYFLFF